MKAVPLFAWLILPAALGLFCAAPARADDPPRYTLTIKDHKFDPAELEIPKGTKIKLVVKNLDPTPEEFESQELKREKVVAGNGEIIVNIGPLYPGRYEFYGDFHPQTTRGAIVVKP